MASTPNVAHATLTIHDAGTMTKRERAEIIKWLRHCATSLNKDGHKYAKRFTARYMK